LGHRYDKVTLSGAALDTRDPGTFSPRTYRLAQACDCSITECALALFGGFCNATCRVPDVLFRAAYPDERQAPNWSGVVIAAEWQGVLYPASWDAAAVAGLLESLHAINYHSL